MDPKKVTSIWNWDAIKGESAIASHNAVLLYSTMSSAMNAGNSGMAGLVHRHGLSIQFQHPSDQLKIRAKTLEANFISAWESEMDWIMSEEAGDKQLTKHDLRAMRSAVDKVSAAIGFGGDLTVLTTTSQCEKFNKEHRITVKNKNMAADIRKEAEAIAETVEGLKPGSPEFDKFVAAYVSDKTPDNIKGGKSSAPALSSMQVYGQKLGGLFTKLEEAGYDDKKLLDLMNSIELQINKRLAHLVESAAIESGVLDDDLSLDAAS